MSAKVLITGGTGLVGTELTRILTKKGFEVSHLSRKANSESAIPVYAWNVTNGTIDEEALAVDHIVHLAGAGVADQKWTNSRKEIIYQSRIASTELLKEKVSALGIKLKSFISASAIGYYGLDTADETMTEESPSANDFLAGVVKDWEAAADQFENLSDRVVKVRIGIVLAKHGGALPKLVQPVKYGVGAPLGDGSQYMSWIHLRDLVAIFSWALENEIDGVFNAVAPEAVSNKKMTQEIASVLNRPLLLPPVPSFALKFLLGEMSGIVLGGNKVSSKKLVDAGFNFEFQSVTEALRDLLK